MPTRRRILVVTLHAAGNWPPELALIRALTRAGHHVRVISDEQHASQILAAGAEYRPYQYAKQRDPSVRRKDPSNEMLRILREVFLNSAYAPMNCSPRWREMRPTCCWSTRCFGWRAWQRNARACQPRRCGTPSTFGLTIWVGSAAHCSIN